MFRDTDVLYEELAANLETPVEFYVYNADSDEVLLRSKQNATKFFHLLDFLDENRLIFIVFGGRFHNLF